TAEPADEGRIDAGFLLAGAGRRGYDHRVKGGCGAPQGTCVGDAARRCGDSREESSWYNRGGPVPPDLLGGCSRAPSYRSAFILIPTTRGFPCATINVSAGVPLP